jgi:hypothetical protein
MSVCDWEPADRFLAFFDTPQQNAMLLLGCMLVGFTIDVFLNKKFLLTMPTGNGFATMFRFKMMRHLSRLPYTYQSVADTSRCVSAPQPSPQWISQQPQSELFTATARGSSLAVGPGRVQRTESVVQSCVQLLAAFLAYVQGADCKSVACPSASRLGLTAWNRLVAESSPRCRTTCPLSATPWAPQ